MKKYIVQIVFFCFLGLTYQAAALADEQGRNLSFWLAQEPTSPLNRGAYLVSSEHYQAETQWLSRRHPWSHPNFYSIRLHIQTFTDEGSHERHMFVMSQERPRYVFGGYIQDQQAPVIFRVYNDRLQHHRQRLHGYQEIEEVVLSLPGSIDTHYRDQVGFFWALSTLSPDLLRPERWDRFSRPVVLKNDDEHRVLAHYCEDSDILPCQLQVYQLSQYFPAKILMTIDVFEVRAERLGAHITEEQIIHALDQQYARIHPGILTR